MEIPFFKYQALGNDFIIVENKDLPSPEWLTPQRAEQLCHRNFGIGADGILLLTPPAQPDESYRMTIFNADGSRAEMCGNGLRCFARYLWDSGHEKRREFTIQTDRGPLRCQILNAEGPGNIRAEVGPPLEKKTNELQIEDSQIPFYQISMGNPHAVFFDFPLPNWRELAPAIESHPMFPNRTNVEFASQLGDTAVKVRVYERGSGWTLACGTGAAATAVAFAMKTGKIPSQPIEIQLPGGTLQVEISPNFENIHLIGPAQPVFRGFLFAG